LERKREMKEVFIRTTTPSMARIRVENRLHGAVCGLSQAVEHILGFFEIRP
jgi:hypothetical protein